MIQTQPGAVVRVLGDSTNGPEAPDIETAARQVFETLQLNPKKYPGTAVQIAGFQATL